MPQQSLAELLSLLEDSAPLIPDAVTDYYLNKAGFESDDVVLKRLLGLATQKFISDLATDALQHSKIRLAAGLSKDKKLKDKRNVLSLEDITAACNEQGIKLSKPEYFLQGSLTDAASYKILFLGFSMKCNLYLIPPELLLKVTEFLDSESLRLFRNCSRPIFGLINHLRFQRLFPRLLLKNVDLNGFTANFNQEEDLNYVYDHKVVVHIDNGYINKYMGCRAKSDQVLFSRLPINIQASMHGASQNSVYFEIKVLESALAGYMRVGLVSGSNDDCHPPGCISGVGYSSTDGNLALASQDGDKFQFGPYWSKNDTVGVGLARDQSGTNIIYFTLNGNWIGEAPSDIDGKKLEYSGSWYAAFSSTGPCQIKINTGQEPFLFNIVTGQLPKYLESMMYHIPSSSYNTQLEMVPCNLPKISDPFQTPTVINNVIKFPDNGGVVARMVMCNSCVTWNSNPRNIFYFEVQVLEPGHGLNSFISIGLSVKPTNPFHQIGWNRFTIGYHSDDGKIYRETHQNGMPFGPTFNQNDIVGCAYEHRTGSVYFTLNGKLLGTAATSFFGNFYASVSAIRDWELQVNLGEFPFAYDPSTLIGR